MKSVAGLEEGKNVLTHSRVLDLYFCRQLLEFSDLVENPKMLLQTGKICKCSKSPFSRFRNLTDLPSQTPNSVNEFQKPPTINQNITKTGKRPISNRRCSLTKLQQHINPKSNRRQRNIKLQKPNLRN